VHDTRQDHHVEGVIFKRQRPTVSLNRLDLNSQVLSIGAQRSQRLGRGLNRRDIVTSASQWQRDTAATSPYFEDFSARKWRNVTHQLESRRMKEPLADIP